MSIQIRGYEFGNIPGSDVRIREFVEARTAEEFFLDTGGATTSGAPAYNVADSFNVYFHRDTNTNILSLVGVFNKTDGTRTSATDTIEFTVGNLSYGFNIDYYNDNNGTDTLTVDEVDAFSAVGSFAWNVQAIDGFVISGFEPRSYIYIDVTSYGSYINQFVFHSNDETQDILPFSTSTIVQLSRVYDAYSGDMRLDPPPSIYDEAKEIRSYFNSNVQNIILTSDGTSPALAEYIAYDDLEPPNPFIATVQDGRGNVVFDGGFPKWYNSGLDPAWTSSTSFSSLTPRYQYFINALDWLSNQDKVNAGNNKVLFLNDRDATGSYSIKGTDSNDFNDTINLMCDIAGYTPVVRDIDDWGGVLNPSYSFLNQHCAVFLFSTLSTTAGNGALTSQAISNLVTFRQEGNGILIITDHGSGSDGFYVTANQLAAEYGALFQGNISRTSVTVQYLRDNFGNHPLWQGMDGADSLYAGGSESEVVITQYTQYTPSTAPAQLLDQTGYTTYKFLLIDDQGNFINKSFTYGLDTAEVLEFKDENDNPITDINVGTSNTVNLNFDLIPGGFSSLTALIKYKNNVIGEAVHDGSIQKNTYYRHDGNEIIVSNNDVITVQITDPIEYVKNLSITRFQPPIDTEYAYSRFMNQVLQQSWSDTSLNRNLIPVLDDIQQSNKFSIARNTETVRRYINNTLELPQANALIYSSTTNANNALSTKSPPTQQAVFNNWHVFASQDADESFYDTKADAPDVEPYNTWVYNSSTNAIEQTANTGYYTGFVSDVDLETYTLEATLTSPGADNDMIGIVAAHYWDGTANRTLNFIVTNGGYSGGVGNNLFVAALDIQGFGTTNTVLATRNHDIMNAGWNGNEIRVKVERNKNIIKAYASNWNQLDSYNPASEIIVDLNSTPELQNFLGPKAYGYSSNSQANSTYKDTSITGGINYNFLVDVQSNTIYQYNYDTLVWDTTGLTLQDVYGYDRVVRNPETGEEFYITETSITQIT